MNWDGGPERTKPDEGGQRRLRGLGSFGSCDEFLVVILEQKEMLIAHEIGPVSFFHGIHYMPKRAKFDACPSLAMVSCSHLRRGAVARCRFFHGTNIALSSDQILVAPNDDLSQREPNQRFARSRYVRNHFHVSASAYLSAHFCHGDNGR